MADTIVLKVELQDAQALAGLQNIDSIVKSLNSTPIKLSMQGGAAQMNSIASGAEKLAAGLKKAGNGLAKLETTKNTFGETTKVVETYNRAIGETTKIIKTFDAATGDLKDRTSVFTQDLEKQTGAVKKQAAAINNAVSAYKQFEDRMAAPRRNTPMQNRIDNMLGIGRETDWSLIKQKFRNPEKYWGDQRVGTSGWEFDRQIEAERARQREFAKSLRDRMQLEEAEAKAAKAAAGSNSPMAASKNRHLLGDSLGNIALKMGAWQIMGATISGVIRSFTDAVRTMKEVDSELVNIRKVTNMSEKDMEKLGNAAYSTASKYGVAADEYLESVTVFSKAGYKDMAQDLGELAIKTELVGDVSAEMASKFLLSVDAAYKMGGSVTKLSTVLDKANEIENNYATSIEKIAEGMPIVASVANTAHMSIDETMAALGTITATTQESGTMAARALRALILNIMGDTKTEIEEGVSWTESEIESLNDVLWKYSKSAMEAAQASGQVVNPMEAIAGLSQAFKEGVLSEAQLVEIVTDLGGKLRTNQLLALIKNFETYSDMLSAMGDAAGSADKEVDTMLSAWERKSQVLKNTWTEFLTNFVDTDLAKGAIDTLTGAISGLNSLMKDGVEKAQEYEDSVKAAFEQDYGEGSRYEYLIENQKTLNELEREELTILEAKKKAREEEAAAAELEKWEKWQDQYVGARGKKQTYDPMTGTLYDTGAHSDIDMLQSMQKTMSVANSEFEKTANLEAYKSALSGVVGEYATYVQEIQDAKAAGYEVSDQQENQVETFKALTSAMASGGEGLEVYGLVMRSVFTSMGYSAEEATQKAKEAIMNFGSEFEDVGEEKAEPEVEVSGADEAIEAANSVAKALNDIPLEVNPTIKVGGFAKRFFAGGTRNAPGGPALVNDGSGPEIISANGMAFVAGGGRPAIVDLPRGATVLTAEESRRAMGGSIPAFKGGTGLSQSKIAALSALSSKPKYKPDNKGFTWQQDADGNYIRNPRKPKGAGGSGTAGTGGDYGTGGGYGGSSGGGYSGPDFEALEKSLDDTLKNLDAQAELAENEGRFVDAMKIYGEAQDEIGKLLDEYRAAGYDPDSNEILELANRGYGYADKQLGTYDRLQKDLIDALNKLNSSVEDANALEERKKAVEDAREALKNAESQRMVRIYNPATGQWEWVADAKDVQSAQERLQNAEKNLQNEQIKQDIDAIKNADRESIGSLTISPALRELINKGSDADKQAFANALGILGGGNDFIMGPDGKTQFNGSDSHDINYNFPGGIVIGENEAESMTLKELADKLGTLAMS